MGATLPPKGVPANDRDPLRPLVGDPVNGRIQPIVLKKPDADDRTKE
jgi:hypothetical protein